jgi:hypothetical protein
VSYDTVILTVRHPDYGNEFEVFGPGSTRIIDVDLGSSFDGSPDDRDQAEEWLYNMADYWVELRAADHDDAAESLEGILASTVEEFFRPRTVRRKLLAYERELKEN